MKIWKIAVVLISLASIFSCAAEKKGYLTIVNEGVPSSVIVLAEQPARSAQLAAAELREHIRLMTGAIIPVISEADAVPAGKVPIYVGESGPVRMKGLIGSSMPPQEYVVQVESGAVYMIGRDDNDFGPIDYEKLGTWNGFSLYSRLGTLYAVYDFLERECGVRWYMVTDLGRVVPEKKTLQVKQQDRRVRLWSSYRTIGYPYWPDPADAGAFDLSGVRRFKKYASARDNTLYALRTRYGGEPYAVNHSVYGYYDRFAKEHPDWWVDGVPGKAKQLRYHHPEVIAQVIADAKEYFSHPYKERQKGIKGAVGLGDYFAVAPLDNRDYGSEATPPIQPERVGPGFGAGTASNYIFTWVNKVARGVAQTYPDAWISTIAYAGMFMPPDFKMEPNVAVSFANADGWEDDSFGMKMLKEWRCRVSRLLTWEYNYSWGKFPLLRPRQMASYIGRLRDMGIYGLFMEMGDPGPVISHIDYTVAMRYLTDRDADVGKILDEYYRLFYGPAEKPMREFWTSLQETSANVYEGKLSKNASWVKGATDERIGLWEKQLSRALSLAKKEPYSTRVKLVSDVIMKPIKEEVVQQKKIAEAPLPVLTVPRVSTPPVLDGKLDDAVWQRAAVTEDLTSLGNVTLKTKNYARLAYDDKNLYVGILLEEPFMDKQVLVQMSSNPGICTDDSVELNIDPSPDTNDYIQVMMNAKSALWHWWRVKHAPNLTPDLGIKGKAWRGQKEWTAEFIVPFEHIADKPPVAGEKWTFNILRNRLTVGGGRDNPDTYAVWAVPFAWSFHVKERFGTIIFGERTAQGM